MQSCPERLSQEDLAILELENELVAGHTCKVVRLGGALDTSQLRREIGERLGVAPKLRVRLGEVNGEPWWLPDQDIDLEQHVVEAAAADDERGFLSAVAGLFSQHLDRSRPLWRIDVIPRLADGDSAVIWRIHHALADGMTAMRMAGAVLWDEVPTKAQPAAGSGRARAKSAAAPVPHRPLDGLMTAAREVPQPWLRSPFDGHIDAFRSVALTSLPLGQVKQIAHADDGATVNDVVLARWLPAACGDGSRPGTATWEPSASRCR